MVEEGPYTLTLVAMDNISGSFADFTSTLEVMVDDIEDGTTIACDITIDEDQLTISKSNLLYSPKQTAIYYPQVLHLHHLM